MLTRGLRPQDLTLKHGWRTGAIIPELRSELRIMNTEQYVQTVTWLQTLTGLLEQMQVGGLLAPRELVGGFTRSLSIWSPEAVASVDPGWLEVVVGLLGRNLALPMGAGWGLGSSGCCLLLGSPFLHSHARAHGPSRPRPRPAFSLPWVGCVLGLSFPMCK